jgi:GntR family transcriptional regulator
MGALKVGEKLPSVKEVVAEVAINPNTVMKAYWELEHEGLVEGRQGVGTYAIEPDGPTSLGPMPGEYLMAPMTAWHSWTLPTSRQ